MPASCAEILQMSWTAVASVKTSAAPPTTRLPRCTICHGCGCPSFAEYSHIGETTIRFFNSMSRIFRGVNSFMLEGSRAELALLLRRWPLAEKCSPYADLRCAFFDGYFKIMRHPHRQHRQPPSNLRFQLIAKLAQPPKIRPHLLCIIQKRRNAHEPI